MNCITQTMLDISIYLRGIHMGFHGNSQKLSIGWHQDCSSLRTMRENPILSYTKSYFNNIPLDICNSFIW